MPTARSRVITDLPSDIYETALSLGQTIGDMSGGQVREIGRVLSRQMRKSIPEVIRPTQRTWSERVAVRPTTTRYRNVERGLNRMDKYYIQPALLGAGVARAGYNMMRPSTAPTRQPLYTSLKGSVNKQLFGKRTNITQNDLTDLFVRTTAQNISPYLHLAPYQVRPTQDEVTIVKQNKPKKSKPAKMGQSSGQKGKYTQINVRKTKKRNIKLSRQHPNSYPSYKSGLTTDYNQTHRYGEGSRRGYRVVPTRQHYRFREY
jgi:hypothetical protein